LPIAHTEIAKKDAILARGHEKLRHGCRGQDEVTIADTLHCYS